MDKKNEQHSSLEEQDVLNLPPRSETHADDGKKGKKLKMRHPLIRFLLFCFLLIPIVVFMYTYYGQPVQNEKKGYEIVNVQENKPLATKEPQSEKQTGQKVDKKEQEKKSDEERKEKEETKEETKEEHYTLHTVVAGDTLYSVSMKYYQTRDGESFIRSLNGLTSNELTPGQLLKIPPKAEIGLK